MFSSQFFKHEQLRVKFAGVYAKTHQIKEACAYVKAATISEKLGGCLSGCSICMSLARFLHGQAAAVQQDRKK